MIEGAPLLVGQSLELWRPPLSEALRRREPGPLVARARRQLEAARAAGLARVALDLNLGLGEGVAPAQLANDLVWAASAIRGAAPGVAIWLDCGSHEALTAALVEIPPPLTVNAVFLDRPGARDLLAVAAEAGAGVVVSPADRAGAGPRRPPARRRARPRAARGVGHRRGLVRLPRGAPARAPSCADRAARSTSCARSPPPTGRRGCARCWPPGTPVMSPTPRRRCATRCVRSTPPSPAARASRR